MILARPRRVIGAFALAVSVSGNAALAQDGPPVHEAAAPAIGGGDSACGRWDGYGGFRFAAACRARHEANLLYGSQDLPLGTSVYTPMQIQVANAAVASMVLYRYDFIDGTAELNPRGRERLCKIAALLPMNFAPIVIERTVWAPELDAARRLMVVNELMQTFPVPIERVVVGPAIANGFSGLEAEIIYRNLLIQTQSGGVVSGSGTSGPGGHAFGGTGGSIGSFSK